MRELENVLERAWSLAQHDVIMAEELPAELRDPAPRSTEGIPPDRPTLNELKRRYIRRVIEESGGNVTRRPPSSAWIAARSTACSSATGFRGAAEPSMRRRTRD